MSGLVRHSLFDYGSLQHLIPESDTRSTELSLTLQSVCLRQALLAGLGQGPHSLLGLAKVHILTTLGLTAFKGHRWAAS